MKSQPLLRLDKSPATQRPPSADNVDLIYDAESSAIKAIDADGDVPFAGASVTAESLVAAAADMTNEQKQSLLPETLEVDYITTEDQSGYEVPAFSFGHKGGIPYFGNAPLISATTRLVDESLVSTGSESRVLIASFPITAERMAAGNWLLSLALQFNFSAASADAWGMVIDFDAGTDSTTGSFLTLGHSQVQQLLLNGVIEFKLFGGFLAPEIPNTSRPLIVANGGAQTHTSGLLGKLLEYGVDYSLSGPSTDVAGVANNLNFYLTDFAATASQTATVAGQISLVPIES